jgi:hypothetical protein
MPCSEVLPSPPEHRQTSTANQQQRTWLGNGDTCDWKSDVAELARWVDGAPNRRSKVARGEGPEAVSV